MDMTLPIEVRPCSIAEMAAAPNIGALLFAYAHESSVPELGAPRAQVHTYRKLEAAGVLHPLGAFNDSELVGFLLLLVTVLPHYGVPAATTESFFVLPEVRKHGVGLQLLAHAEARARDLGAKAVLVSSPAGSALDRVLSSKKEYRCSNIVHVKALA